MVVNLAQKLIFKFFWDEKPPKIKNNVLTNSLDTGGLKIPDIDCLVKSQKAAWIKRFVTNPDASWLQFLYQYLPDMSLSDLLKCSVNPEELSQEIPMFYRQILYAWYQLKQKPESPLDIRREILWFNEDIKIDHSSVFYQSLYNKGLLCVNDLLNATGNFVNNADFVAKYDTINLVFTKLCHLLMPFLHIGGRKY